MNIDLNCILDARSVAIIGASADPTKIGGRPIAYLLRAGYTGRIIPVNPMRAEVQGLVCVPTIEEAGEVDLAVIAMPSTGVRDAVSASMSAGVKGLILFTAGYAETGDEGASEQRKLLDLVNDGGGTMLGPNCLGAVNIHSGLTGTFATALDSCKPVPGGLSYFGQSGALGAYWIEIVTRAGLGIAKWITTGNEAQVTGADALHYLSTDPATSIIAGYIEDIKKPELFAEAAQAARAAGKQILVLKSGRSEAGSRAAAAHTASNPGNDDWYNGFFADCGVIPVRSIREMVDTARILRSEQAVRSASNLGVVTISGGAGILICDSADREGVGLARFSPQLTRALESILPGYASAKNPVDVTGALVSDQVLLERVLATIADSRECDVLVLFLGSMSGIADSLLAAISSIRSSGQPIVVIWMAPPDGVISRIGDMGIAAFDEIPSAIAAIAAASRG